MANKKELEALIVLAGKVDPSLKSAISKATSETDKFGKNAKKSASEVSGVGNIIKGVFAGNILSNAVTNIAGKLLDFGKSGLQLASDLTEVQNVVDVTFGNNASQVNQWSQTALKSFGLSELAAKQYNGTLGAMLKSSGITGQSMTTMSENLTGLAGDLSSFYNLSQDDAFQKIQSGLAGETEPLRQLGINMSVANLQAFAMSKGIKTSYQKMDQASQVALRYSYLMAMSKDAQGDFARTQGSFANQSRLLTTNLQQLAAKMAQGVLPMLSKLTQAANNFLSGSGGQALSNFFQNLFNSAGSLMPVVAQLMTVISSIGPPVAGLIQQLMPSLVQLATAIMPILSKVIQIVVEAIKPIIPVITNLVKMLLPPLLTILGALTPLFSALVPVIQFLGKVIAFYITTRIQELMPWINWMANNFKNLIGILTSVINFIVDVFSGNWQKAWQDLGNIVTGIFKYIGEGIKGFLNAIIGSFNAAIGGINKIIGAVGKAIGIKVQIPLIPTFAKGGFANQPSIFGEAGPEAAIPIKYKNPRSLALLKQTARAIGADNNETSGITLVYSPNIYGGESSQVSSTLKEDFERFKNWAEAYFEEKARVSLG